MQALNGKQDGLTLIEVLVASVIMFAAIAAVSLVYKGAITGSEKAEVNIKLASAFPVVIEDVKEVLRSRNSSEAIDSLKGRVFDVDYQWRAETIRADRAPKRLDTDTGNYVVQPERYLLWKVDIEMRVGTLTRAFEIYELSWLTLEE